MPVSHMPHDIVDRPFSRAKTDNFRRSPIELKPRFRVQKQLATTSPVDTKANFGAKPRSGSVAGHAVGHTLPS